MTLGKFFFSVYDQVGWISPVIVCGKLFIQQLWKKNVQWDELLPSRDAEDWRSYIDKLRFVSDVTIPRWIGLDPYALHSELYGFCDASERAYGAVIYLRVVGNSGRISVTLLTIKTEVGLIKQVCIPRLELQASVLLARLIPACCQVRALNTQHPIVLAKHKIVNLIIQRVHRQCLHGRIKLKLSTLRPKAVD